MTRAIFLSLALALAAGHAGPARGQQEGGPAGAQDPRFGAADDARREAGSPGSGREVDAELMRRMDALRAIRTRIANDAELSQDVRGAALEAYDSALGRLEAAADFRAEAQSFTALVQSGSENEKALRDQARALESQPGDTAAADIDSGSSAEALERQLLQQKAELDESKRAVAALEREIDELQARPAAARQALSEASARLAVLDEAPTPADGVDGVVAAAQQELLAARRTAREAEVDALERELSSIDIRLRVRTAGRALATARTTRLESVTTALQTAFEARRQHEAQTARAAAQQAQIEAAGEHPILGWAAAINLELSEELAAATQRMEKSAKDRTGIAQRKERYAQDFEQAQQRLEVSGLSEALGRLLSDQRSRLPDLRHYAKVVEARRQRMSEVGLRQLQLSEARSALASPQGAVEAASRAYAEASTGAFAIVMTDGVERKLKALLDDRRELYEQLGAGYASYLRVLGDLDFEHRELIDLGERYRAFLDERLLWIPSAAPVGLDTLRSLPAATAWLLSPRSLIETGQTLMRIAVSDWGWTLVAIVGPIVLFRLRTPMRRRMEWIADQTRFIQKDSFWLTLRAIVLTVCIAGALPLLIGMVGWRLNEMVAASDYAQAVGAGGVVTAWLLLAVLTLLVLCRRNGVAQAHFHWSQSGLVLLKRHFSWWVLIAGPAIFINQTLSAQSNDAFADSLGRVAFMVNALSLSLLVYLVLHPERGLPAPHVRRRPGGWTARLRHVWFWAAVATPALFAGLAAVGYFYTAMALAVRLNASVAVIVGAISFNYVVLRWLHVNRRRLEFKLAVERRDAARAARAAAGTATADDSADGAQVVLDNLEVDIEAVDTQTRDMLKALVYFSVLFGLWVVWSDVLPALGFLSEVELWRYTTTLDGAESSVPVTLESLVLIVFFGALLVVAAKNLPGVLEIAVLQRLPIDAGARYAFTSIAQYLIVAAGVVLIFDRLGVGWGNVQWLVAALGVGLGFGLQEIFANFVSGIIILFERPIRIGDTVTVGNVSGTVTRIRIRAATIVDWDNKEIIVPNKTFITGQLVNWTLSDPITRVVIPIGIAYGSDVKLAHRLIGEVADANPMVLEFPERQLFFLGLGDSSLDFELRVFVKVLSDRLPVTHELLTGIEKTLRENGISIPFPQRDVHVHWEKPARPIDSPDDAESLSEELASRAAE